MIETKNFSESPEGTVFGLLLKAYADFPELVEAERGGWKKFDAFVYAHLPVMDRSGFLSAVNGAVIGFFSWDPRKLPESIEIGHNCLLPECRGRGLGKEQLSLGLARMGERKPGRIIVKTGNIPFFLPARRMYESAGFKKSRIEKRADKRVPEIVEYEITLP